LTMEGMRMAELLFAAMDKVVLKKLSDREQEEEFKQLFKAYPIPMCSVKTVADHIDHIKKVAGIDHIGLGSDFDGIEAAPLQLDDVSKFPYLTQELLN